jgi:hypothetical protein
MSNFLPHSSEQERADLILIEETKKELNVDPSSLGRHSSVEVLFKCVVCQQPHKLSKKRVMDGKGMSHPGECRTQFKQAGGVKAVQNTSPEKRQNRLEKAREAIITNQEEIVKKRKKTNLEKYGTEIAQRNAEVRAKMSLGIKVAYEDGSTVKKRRETNLEKYGNTNYLASDEGISLIKKVNNEKYNVDYPFQSSEFKEKFPSILKSKYGVENYRQLPEQRNKLKQWCIDNPDKLYTSKAEQEILDWIRTLYPEAAKFRKESNEIDIFVPSINLGIEHNGLYYHSMLFKEKEYHINKTKFFESHNIRVIHIWEHEWKYRKEQVKSFITSALGKNEFKLNARNCNIRWSSLKEEIAKAHVLIDATHIQGHTNSTKYVANVYYKEDLIATATFGKHHRGKDEWVLTRFCTKKSYTVRGLLSKISKIAYKNLQEPLTSWADYRLSQGNGYLMAGWQLEDTLKPDYFYFKTSTLQISSKQSRQKRLVKTPQELTEYEHAQLEGLEQVWDCGKIRFKYNPQK